MRDGGETMENPSLLQNLAVTARSPRADGVPQPHGLLTYLRGRKGRLLVAAALGISAFLAGWRWFGTAAVLPLLYTLPCVAMMAMCMRGHGTSGNTPTTPNDSTVSGPDANQ
jgi:hypothetical protein